MVTTEPIIDIAYGNGKYVGLTERGGFLVSGDGKTWTYHPLDQRFSGFTSIAYGSGRFVAVERNGLWSSDDGIQWKEIDTPRLAMPFYGMTQVTFANGQFVAVGHAQVGESTDGLTWEWNRFSETTRLLDVTYFQGQWLAVGEGVNGFIHGVVVSSPDAKQWTTLATHGTAITGIASDENRAVAVGSEGAVFSSADGTTWSTREWTDAKRLARPWRGVELIDGKLFAWDVHGDLWLSDDGDGWARHSDDASLPDITRITRAGGQNWLVGQGGALFASADGTSWVRATPTGVDLRLATEGRGRFLGVDADHNILLSTDGITWTATPIRDREEYLGLTYADGRYVLVGGLKDLSGLSVGLILVSDDGLTWARHMFFTMWQILDVVYADGRFIAVSIEGIVLESPDGSTWTEISRVKNDPDPTVKGMAFANGRLVVTTTTALYVSTDGVLWNKVYTFAAEEVLLGIRSLNGNFFAFGNKGFEPLLLQSTDGQTWLRRSIPGDSPRRIVEVTHSSEGFIALPSFGSALESPDGVTWKETAQTPGDSIHRVIQVRGRLLAFGVNGTIWTKDVKTACGFAFPDVPSTDPGCQAIESLYDMGVVNGAADGKYNPDRPVTRAEFAKMLVLALGHEPLPGKATGFSDTASHWAARQGYIQAAVELQAILGYPDGRFAPDQPLTPAQALKIAAASMGLQPHGTYSGPLLEGTWSEGWIAAAAEADLFGAGAPYRLWGADAPRAGVSVTRWEAAQLLANLVEVRAKAEVQQ